MKRLQLPDLLKGFAVFLIVPVHILETFIDFPGRESVFGKTLLFLGGPIAVPVFMIVMGYFLAKNQKPFTTNFFRGIKIFMAGLLLNIGLNFHLLLKIKFAGWQYNPMEYIFGVDIFYFAGLAIIFLSVLKTIKSGREWLALLLVFAVAGATSFVNQKLMVPERNYIFPFIGGTWSWSYFPLFPWLAYPLAGFAFFYFEQKIMGFFRQQKIVSGVVLVVIFAFVLYFRKSGFETTINLPAYYHHTFWFSIWAFGVVILWSVFWQLMLNKFSKTRLGEFFMWLGKNITVFYIIQWLIIGNIATAIYQTQPLSRFPLWFAGIFSITVLITWLVETVVKKHIKQI
jgi:uncharacterized membrane protein (UPF0136 family)